VLEGGVRSEGDGLTTVAGGLDWWSTLAKAWQERETVGEGRRWMLASYSAKMAG
jgi:hypothetical protein